MANYVKQFNLVGNNVALRGIKIKDEEFRDEQTAKNADLDDAIEGLNTRVTDLEQAGTELDVPSLAKKIAPHMSLFNGRKMIFCCDSYGAHRDEFKQFPELIADKLAGRAYVVNISKGSTGFVGGANGTQIENFQAREPSFASLFRAAGWTDYNANEVSDIFFGCGHNDNNNTASDITNAMRTLHDYIKPRYPNATIWVIYASTDESEVSSGESYDGHTVRSRCFNNVYRPFSKCGDFTNMMFIDATGVFSDRHALMRDYVHPNAAGSKYLMYSVLGALSGSHYAPKYRATVTLDSNVIQNASSLILDTSVENGSIRVSILNASFLTFVTPVTAPSTAGIIKKIGTISSGECLWMIQDNEGNNSWPVIFTTARSADGTTYGNAPLGLNIDADGNLYVRVEARQMGMATEGVKVIYLSQQTLTMDCFN